MTAVKSQKVVVKIGSSSVTGADGHVSEKAVSKLCVEISSAVRVGHQIILVSSGAIATGLAAFGFETRPSDMVTLQAVAAVGQHRLMQVYSDAFASRGLMVGQVLLAPLDFAHRIQYLHARRTLARLLELGVLPVVNENDATSDDEIRLGDNDRLAALVAHMVSADLLVLLTDTAGLLTGDPKTYPDASLIEEVTEIDRELEALAGGPGSISGSGGMSAKLQAAKIAAWSGVETVIADAEQTDVIQLSLNRTAGVGTMFRAHSRRLSARKLWIAFALPSSGKLSVDSGARTALRRGDASLLSVGVVGSSGDFREDDAVEIAGPDGLVFAKGLVRYGSEDISRLAGESSRTLPTRVSPEVVHKDDLVILE
ncbi:MAG: glutamate 5-kinase [Acidimicrobiales bacterium]